MRNHSIFPGIALIIIFMFIQPAVSLPATSLLAHAGSHSVSPLNPDYISYIKDEENGSLDVSRFDTSPLGYVPPTVDLSHTRGSQVFSTSSNTGTYRISLSGTSSYTSALNTGSALPSRFDLRSQGKLTPVKDQGTCGSCWAFSTFASLESGFLPEKIWDFSENNMKNTHGFDIPSCKGGNALMATAYLTRWSGPLVEQKDPYKQVQVSGASPTVPNTASVKQVREVLFISGRSSATDNQNIKQALMQYGAVYSTVHWEDASYSSSSASYYYGGSSRSNHAVTIVGWDDSYDRSLFPSRAPGNGAFIVRNSWGDEWGDDGYFYVSYYDTAIGIDNAVFCAGSTDDYDYIYQYDPLGWITSYGDGEETEYFANVFTAQADEKIAAVGFYTPAVNSQFEISVYRGVYNTPVSGSSYGKKSGTISSLGYHTVTLSEPVPVRNGEKFSVVVKLTTPGYQYPVAVEYPSSGYSSQATAHSGESYVSDSGSRWTDISTIYSNTNVCLKALTVRDNQVSMGIPASVTPTTTSVPNDTTLPSVSIRSPGAYVTVTPGQALAVTWSATDNTGVAGVSVEYSVDDKVSWTPAGTNLASSGSITVIVPSSAGSTFTIRVTAWDASGNERSSIRTCSVKTTSFGRSIFYSSRETSASPIATRTTKETLMSDFRNSADSLKSHSLSPYLPHFDSV